jgi:hypothetical protein
MLRSYLYLNTLLYAGLAVWCTVDYLKTSRGSGYVELDQSGRSEYLVIYGGLQLGLALFYFYLGRYPAAVGRVGIIFSLVLYAPIVLYRVATIIRFSPVSAIT